MITPVVETRARRWRSYRVLAVTELRLAWRYSVGLVFGVGLPMLLLVIFGLCVAAFAPSPQVADAIGSALFHPFAFFSGLYVPLIEFHSGVINQIAKVLPSGAAFNALNASLAGRFPGGEAVGVLVGYAIVSSAIAVRWFRWDVERPHSARRADASSCSRPSTNACPPGEDRTWVVPPSGGYTATPQPCTTFATARVTTVTDVRYR